MSYERPWGDKNDAYEDGYKRGFADALEAAARENDKAAEFEEANEHDFDSVTIPMHAAAAMKTAGAAIRKLKPEVGNG